jgi:hypothetical protein
VRATDGKAVRVSQINEPSRMVPSRTPCRLGSGARQYSTGIRPSTLVTPGAAQAASSADTAI